jgi:hypothetical protein
MVISYIGLVSEAESVDKKRRKDISRNSPCLMFSHICIMCSTCVQPLSTIAVPKHNNNGSKKNNKFTPSFVVTTMSTKRQSKRKRGPGPMIVGDVESAQVVTPKTIYETKSDGTLATKQVWESLEEHVPDKPVVESHSEIPSLTYEPVDDNPSPQPESTQTYRVSKDVEPH